MLMPGRKDSPDAYRFGITGMEKDNEIKGSGNSYDFGGRSIYDGRLARFISTDPRWQELPHLSPYAYAANNPVLFIDENGEFPGLGWLLKLGLIEVPSLKEYGMDHGYAGGLAAGLGDSYLEGYAAGAEMEVEMNLRNFIPYYTAYKTYQDGKQVFAFANTMYSILSDEQGIANLEKAIAEATDSYVDQVTGDKGSAEMGYAHGKLAAFAIETAASGGGALKSTLKGLKQAAKTGKANPELRALLSKMKFDCACFVGGTLVLTEAGFIPIELIKTGETNLLAERDSTLENQQEVQLIPERRQVDHVRIITIGSDTLFTTDEHLFYHKNQWIKAPELPVGDTLQVPNAKRPLVVTGNTRIDSTTTILDLKIIRTASPRESSQVIKKHSSAGNVQSDSFDPEFNGNETDVEEAEPMDNPTVKTGIESERQVSRSSRNEADQLKNGAGVDSSLR